MSDTSTTPDLMPGMYDEAATAAAIRLKPTSLRNIRLRGDGPAYSRIGNKIYYAEADVKAWLAKKRVQPGAVRADLTAPTTSRRLAKANEAA